MCTCSSAADAARSATAVPHTMQQHVSCSVAESPRARMMCSTAAGCGSRAACAAQPGSHASSERVTVRDRQ